MAISAEQKYLESLYAKQMELLPHYLEYIEVSNKIIAEEHRQQGRKEANEVLELDAKRKRKASPAGKEDPTAEAIEKFKKLPKHQQEAILNQLKERS